MSLATYPTGSKRPWDTEAATEVPKLEEVTNETPRENGGKESSSESESQDSSNVSGISEDVDTNIDDIKEILQNCLDGISSIADQDWAFGDRLDQAPNLGLTLKSRGIVGLPLSAQDAGRIRKEANPDHPPDTMSGNACVLSPDRFELRNPAWNQYVQDLASKLLATEIQHLKIKLVNLIVTDDVHCDPEEAAIDTTEPHLKLAIFLPSFHTGGEINCTVPGYRSKSFNSAPYSEFGLSYVACYSDVLRRHMPLTAGTRICLTYSVFSTGSIRLETATSLFHDARDFECEIGKWNRLRKSEDVPNLLAYVLEDRYSDEVLEFASLTAVDRLKAKFLRERCEQSGVRPFLSKMTGTKTLGYTYRPDESTMELNDLVDFDGKDVLDATVGIEAGSIVQKDIYNGRESDDPDQDYYPGEEFEEREGESYVDFVFVLIPEDFYLEFIVANTKEDALRTWIAQLRRILSSDSPPDSAKVELSYIVSTYSQSLKIQPQRETWSYYGEHGPEDPQVYYRKSLSLLIRASILLQDRKLFAKSLCKDPAYVPQDVYVDIGKALNERSIEVFKEGLDQVLTRFKSLDARYRVLHNLLSDYSSAAHDDVDRRFLDDWVFHQVEKALSSLGKCCAQDAHAMTGIGERYGAEFLIQRIVPSAATQAHNFDFIVTFLERLRANVESGAVSKETASTAAQDILPRMTSTFAKHLLRPSTKRPKLQPDSDPSNSGNVFTPTEGHRMASVVGLCVTLDLKAESDCLLQSVTNETSRGDAWWLRNILMPFLQDLAAMMQIYGVSPHNATYQNLFRTGLICITAKYIGCEPPCPSNWILPGRDCGLSSCKACKELLDPFLRDPHRHYMEFKSTGLKRTHMEERVRDESSIRTSTTMNDRAPHNLVLQKTRDGYDRALQAWRGRGDEYRKLIRGIDDTLLRQLLNDKFSDLTEPPCVEREPGRTISGQHGSARQPLANIQPSLSKAGVKPEVEVIDLED